MDIANIINEYTRDISEVDEFLDSLYNEKFADNFKIQLDLHAKLIKNANSVTDEELEKILIDIPLELFTAAANLSTAKTHLEVIKLKVKTLTRELNKLSAEEAEERKLAYEIDDGKLFIAVYTSLIAKVESQISLSKELIMGAKKIWDARRASEHASPVSEVSNISDNLPDYIK